MQIGCANSFLPEHFNSNRETPALQANMGVCFVLFVRKMLTICLGNVKISSQEMFLMILDLG